MKTSSKITSGLFKIQNKSISVKTLELLKYIISADMSKFSKNTRQSNIRLIKYQIVDFLGENA